MPPGSWLWHPPGHFRQRKPEFERPYVELRLSSADGEIQVSKEHNLFPIRHEHPTVSIVHNTSYLASNSFGPTVSRSHESGRPNRRSPKFFLREVVGHVPIPARFRSYQLPA